MNEQKRYLTARLWVVEQIFQLLGLDVHLTEIEITFHACHARVLLNEEVVSLNLAKKFNL